MNALSRMPAIALAAFGMLGFMVISVGRLVWRGWCAALLVARVRGAGNRIRLGTGVQVENPHLISCGSGVSVGDHAELRVVPGSSITLGNQVKIGKRCQLGATPGHIRIGEHASVHSSAILLGSVSIGRYTLLSANIYASSGNHRAFDSPHRLIRDQDLAATRAGREVRPVVIEEDCWIGWGVVVMSGVHIGRGAVVGANAVVTKDVQAYEVVAGQPARVLRKRLAFSPPTALSAANLEDAPYLYRGFLQLQEQRQAYESSHPGHVAAADYAVLVLSAGDGFARLRLRGVALLPGLSLQVWLDGREAIINIPADAGATFDVELPLADFQCAEPSLAFDECRVAMARVFHFTAVYPNSRANARNCSNAAWALHSVTLLE